MNSSFVHVKPPELGVRGCLPHRWSVLKPDAGLRPGRRRCPVVQSVSSGGKIWHVKKAGKAGIVSPLPGAGLADKSSFPGLIVGSMH
jgi:hypothetical protein